MVQKIHPRGVFWVLSSRHPVVFLAPLNSPMRRPSMKKSVSKYIRSAETGNTQNWTKNLRTDIFDISAGLWLV